MRKCWLYLVGLLVFGSLFIRPPTGLAASNLIIEVMEQDLQLQMVKPPDFGRHKIRKERFTITSKTDLVIQITDSRYSKQAGWQLLYQFQPFKKEAQYLAKDVYYQLGTGKLRKKNQQQWQVSSQFQSQPFKTKQQQAGNTIVKKTGETDQGAISYEYRVKKEDIQLTISPDAAAGLYKATQIIVLQNVPTI